VSHRARIASIAAVLHIALLATGHAQATRDQSRLVIGVSAGWIGGSDLWSVPDQPILAGGAQQDVFSLDRRLRSNLTFIGQGTFFPSDHVGITAEVSYLGLGTTDECLFVPNVDDPFSRAVCGAINGDDRSASAVSLTAGVVLRPLSRAEIQPYLRAMAGVALMPRSTIPVSAVLGLLEDQAMFVYLEDGDKDVKPTGTLAFGLSTAPRAGYQLRVEARATAVQLLVVSGPTTSQNQVPPTNSVTKILPSIVVGLDIVLEKRRGRRY
jgi:hypothetical protein